jgi:hypothetical protein
MFGLGVGTKRQISFVLNNPCFDFERAPLVAPFLFLCMI